MRQHGFWFFSLASAAGVFAHIGVFGDLDPQLLLFFNILVLAIAVISSATCCAGGVAGVPTIYVGLLGLYHLGLIGPVLALEVSTGIIASDWLFQSDNVSQALVLCFLAFTSFSFGQLCVQRSKWHPQSHRQDECENVGGPTLTATAVIGWMLYIIGVLASTIWLVGAGSSGATYDESYELRQSTDVRLLTLGLFCIPTGFIALASSRRSATWAKTFLIMLGGSLPVVTFGIRGVFVMSSLYYMLLWYRAVPAVRMKLLLYIAAPAAFLLSLLSVVRGAAGNHSNPNVVYSPWQIIAEPGYSFRTLLATVDEIDAGEPLRWGDSYLRAAELLIPNLGGWQERTSDELMRSPNSWVTHVINPWKAERGYGEGFSAVAEPYLNFGVVGVIAYFICLGAALTILDRLIERNLRWRVIGGCAFIPLMWTVRNDYSGVFRSFSWSLSAIFLGALAIDFLFRPRPGEDAHPASPSGK